MNEDELVAALKEQGQGEDAAKTLAKALVAAFEGDEDPTPEAVAKALKDVVVAAEETETAKAAVKAAQEEAKAAPQATTPNVIWRMKDGTVVTDDADPVLVSMAKEMKANNRAERQRLFPNLHKAAPAALDAALDAQDAFVAKSKAGDKDIVGDDLAEIERKLAAVTQPASVTAAKTNGHEGNDDVNAKFTKAVDKRRKSLPQDSTESMVTSMLEVRKSSYTEFMDAEYQADAE